MQSRETFAGAFPVKPVSTEKLRLAFEDLRHPVSKITDKSIEQEHAGGLMQ